MTYCKQNGLRVNEAKVSEYFSECNTGTKKFDEMKEFGNAIAKNILVIN